MADTAIKPTLLDNIFSDFPTTDGIKEELVKASDESLYYRNGTTWLRNLIAVVGNSIAKQTITKKDLMDPEQKKIFFPDDDARIAYEALLTEIEAESDFSHFAYVSIDTVRAEMMKKHDEMYASLQPFATELDVNAYTKADYLPLILDIYSSLGAIRCISSNQTVFVVLNTETLKSMTEILFELATKNKELFKHVMFLVDFYHGLYGGLVSKGLAINKENITQSKLVVELQSNVKDLEQMVESSVTNSNLFTWTV